MKTNDLAIRAKISVREAERMIWTFIDHGNHSRYKEMHGAPRATIERWFAVNKEPLPKLASRCRSFFETSVPFVENIVGGTWTVQCEGSEAKASMIMCGQSKPDIEIKAPGTVGIDYESKFESACRARNKAIEGASLEEFHTAIIKGIASIESYLAHRVNYFKNQGIEVSQFSESKIKKISLEEKIKDWIPVMTGGTKLNLGGKMWADFLFLQSIRDNDAIHSKNYSQGASFSDLALGLNKFKTGIADFLLQLHISFGEAAPRIVIRAKFFPEVYVLHSTVQ